MRRKKKRRGQAAFEFLTTYGWAFMIMLVMIGALSYFGVLRTDIFLPERCIFEAGITCRDYQAEVGGNLKAKLINTFGKPLQIINTTIDCQGITGTCEPCAVADSWCNLTYGSNIWRLDEEKELIITVTGGIKTTDKPKAKITIWYKQSDDYFDKSTSGDIYLRPS